MKEVKVENSKIAGPELDDLVIISERGTRNKTHGFSKIFIIFVALCWSLFQLWIASPLPYTHFFKDVLEVPVFNSISARYVHLSFAMLLVFLTYPAGTSSSRKNIPFIDWVFAAASVFCCMALYFWRAELARRTGVPIMSDILISACGIILLLEATRRALGKSLVIISIIFLIYAYFGNGLLIPDVIATKAHSLKSIASNQWLSTEGVFGISLGVSAEFVFLFVLFGALLEKSGAGNYFIQLAFSLLGHMRGGPAKAAVLSSALTGTIAGSSIANVVTTGTFTIPLMRRVGYSREKAGAIEVSAGVDGQLMPPVMGTAAFLIAEYIGISYVEVVKAAFLPAILSYMALLYIVHLEAVKSNMRVIPKNNNHTPLMGLVYFGITVSSLLILATIIYYGINTVKTLGGESSPYFIAAIVLSSYLLLLKFSSKLPPLEIDDPNKEIFELPRTFPTFISGLHYLLPLVVLVWCLVIEELTPAASVSWSISLIMFILVTQKPLIDCFKNNRFSQAIPLLKNGCKELFDALTTGARNMLGVSIATAAAGIIVGAITLTGIGQVMTELVELVSGGSFILCLVFTAMICLILGAGLPTTATYIVVASLMAPVVRELGLKAGMDIPLVAVHLFVFYFGIMADVTPPVGLASFAAAAISGGDPVRTGWQGTIYNFRTAILPFIFIYNTKLLLIGIDSYAEGIYVFIRGTVATLLFAAATQGFFIVRTRVHETVLMLLTVFALFRPGYIIDLYTPPYVERDLKNFEQIVEETEVGKSIKVEVTGIDVMGDAKNFTAHIHIQEGKNAKERLKKYGVVLDRDGNKVTVTKVILGSEAKKRGFEKEYAITGVYAPNEQISKNWVVFGAVLALGFIIISQKNRKTMIIMERS